MRRMLLTLVLGALLLGTAHAAQAALLFPDLKTLPPRNLRFDYTDVSSDGSGVMHYVLRFSNTAYNAGAGPVEIRATIDQSLNPPSGPAYQRVYDSNGGYQDFAIGSDLYYHAIHKHYHFDNWGAYQLWTKAAYDNYVSSGVGNPDLVGTKTTSCVEDEEFVVSLANAVWPAHYPSSSCLPNGQNLIVEGLSPGWGDTYDYYRAEQWVDLGTSPLPNGTYVLRSITDPENLIYESPSKSGADESVADNSATITFTVSGGQMVDSDPPTGTVTINHVDTLTTSPNVSLDILGRDDVSGVDQFQVSNDGTHWATYSNTSYDSIVQTISWDLTNATYGGTTAAGTKTVSVRFHDKAGHWGPVETDTIDYEPSPPPPPVSAYARTVQGDGPVGWWRLGEASGTAATDQERASPGTYNGTFTLGAASLLPMDGANTAVALDGASGYVSVPDAPALDLTSPFSLEAWIEPAKLPDPGKFASILTKAESYTLQLDGPQLELAVIQSGTRMRCKAPAGAIQAGTAYHVAGTYDGATERVYVDGQQVAACALTGPASTNASPLTIGSWNGTEYFSGVIDEPAVYDTALSAPRVAAHYAAGSAPVLDAPTGVTANADSMSEIALHWTNTSSGETHEVVERSTDASFSTVASFTLPAGTNAFHDTGLSPGTTYWYRVKATTAFGASPPSTAVQATTIARTYANVVLADHPISYWRLDETSGTVAGDQTVANPGTFVNAILGVPGLLATDPADTAAGFNGTSGDVRIGQAGTLNLSSAMTLEAWVEPATLPPAGGVRSILSKAGAYALELDGPTLGLTIVQLGARMTLDAPVGAIVAGHPAYVAGTWDGATMRLYVDGTQVASRSLGGAADETFGGARIGSTDAASGFFAGTIDEPALYGVALSAAQIAAHYDAGGAIPPPSAPPPATVPLSRSTGRSVANGVTLAARLRPSRIRLRHGRIVATLVLRSSAAGRARLTLVHLTPGIRRGRRCVATHRLHGRRCTSAKALGARTLLLHAGRRSLRLPLRYGRARLGVGRWQLVIALPHAKRVVLTFIVTR